MKRILQAMDGVATKPVVGANDMAKFLSIVDKNASVQLLQEGNPHKVSLPVQMAMQHYQKEECTPQPQVARESIVRKYFDEAEQAIEEEQVKKRNFYKQYAQTIAERVLMKEDAVSGGVQAVKKLAGAAASHPKSTGITAGGGAIHAAAGNVDQDAGDWWHERIIPEIPYSRLELAIDLGVVGAGAVAGAIGGPAGEGAALAANATRVERLARIISKGLSLVGADVKRSGAKLIPPIREWLKAFGRTAITTTAIHTLVDLLNDAVRNLDERSTTEKQARTMAVAAHNPAFAKKVGIDQKVAKEFNQKDKGTALLSNAMKGKRKKVKELDGHSMGFKPQGPGLQSNAPDGGHLNLSELSTEKLAQYKKAAYADAKKADAEGDYERGNKRFKGINKATVKQFDNDLKKHNQSPIKEANAKKRTLKNSNPCWKGYHPVGTKKKGGRTVPNCVPKE